MRMHALHSHEVAGHVASAAAESEVAALDRVEQIEPSTLSAGAKQKAASPSSLASRKAGRRPVTTVPMRSARMSWA